MPPTEPLFHPEYLPEELITRTATMGTSPDGLRTIKTTVAMWYADETLEPLMTEVPSNDLKVFMEGVSFALLYFISVPEQKSEIPDEKEVLFVRPPAKEDPIPEDDIPF